jgi:ribosomal protein S18 acetylase RimI-like enzyme
MMDIIEELNIDDLKESLELVRKVFMEFEAPDYKKEGIASFFKFANYENIYKKLGEDLKILVAKNNNKIVGMIAFSNYKHIVLLFIDKEYQRRGIGTKLINKVKDYCIKNNENIEYITVNSSPFAKEFYHNLGFKDTDLDDEVDGIKFTPMQILPYTFTEYKDEYFEKLYNMKKECFKWYVEKIYGPWKDDIQIEFLNDLINKHRNDIKVIKYKNEIIGLFTNYLISDKENEINLFYIDKKYQNSGIGKNILTNMLMTDKERKVDTVLQVFKENPARFLYKKFGFEVYEETETHYKMKRKVIKDE